jgi:hypothetical protein
MANDPLRKIVARSRLTTLPDSSPPTVPPPPASLSATASAGPITGSRDPLFQPFTSTSPWNHPIGDGAIYRDARMNGQPGNGNVFGFVPNFDGEIIVEQPTSPRCAVNVSSVGWSGGNRCVATGATRTAVPVANSYVIPNSGGNNCAVFLLSDNRTLASMQPWTRCTAGGSATCFAFFANTDVYGVGIEGSHGGSGLSAIGGSLRLGELRPGDSIGPRHALKVNPYARQFLFRNLNASALRRWPADRCDSYATGSRTQGGYGTDPTGTGVDGSNSNTVMVQGTLLALATNFSITANLSSTPARLLAWTLINYGAYIVDDIFATGFALVGEDGPAGDFADQFSSDWGVALRMHQGTNTAWHRSIRTICDNFFVISNNSQSAIGGGGTPLQPFIVSLVP